MAKKSHWVFKLLSQPKRKRERKGKRKRKRERKGKRKEKRTGEKPSRTQQQRIDENGHEL